MILIYKKWGILTAVIPVGLSIIAWIASDYIFGENKIPAQMIFGVCFIISAPIVWILGNKLNNNRSGEMPHPAEDIQKVKKEKHTFFWIPMEYWALPILLIGLFFWYL